MKGTIKNLTLVATMAVMMSACSTMTTVVEKQQDVVPNWYMKCKDTGTEVGFGGLKTTTMLVVVQ